MARKPMAKGKSPNRGALSGWASPMNVQPTVRNDPIGGPVIPPRPAGRDTIGLLPAGAYSRKRGGVKHD